MSNADIWARNAIVTAADPRQTRERLALSEAVYDTGSEYNGVIPEHASAWTRPGENWASHCRCVGLTNAGTASHVCPGAGHSVEGERALALARAVTAGQRTGDADAEVVELTSDFEGQFGLAADIPAARRRALASRGLALPDGSYPVETVSELRSAARLAASKHGDWQAARVLVAKRARQLGIDVSTLPGFGSKVSASGQEFTLAGPQSAPETPGAFDSLADADAYYLDLMKRLGFSIHDTGARDDGDPTDTAQPQKGGKPRPGVVGGIYDSDLGGPEEISARHPEMFTDRGAAWSGDQSQWNQRGRGLAR
jgi:hypothetical protein